MPGTVLKVLQISDWFSLECPEGWGDMSHPVPSVGSGGHGWWRQALGKRLAGVGPPCVPDPHLPKPDHVKTTAHHHTTAPWSSPRGQPGGSLVQRKTLSADFQLFRWC